MSGRPRSTAPTWRSGAGPRGRLLLPAPGNVGLDAAGTVLEVADDVSGVAAGDRVMTTVGGGLAEQVVVDARMVIPVPDAWSPVEGAAAVLGLMTEHNALEPRADCEPASRFLSTPQRPESDYRGCSSLGLGAGTVIASVRTGRARNQLLALGARHVLEVASGTFAGAVQELTGGAGVDVVVDHVGGPYLEENVRAAGTAVGWSA